MFWDSEGLRHQDAGFIALIGSSNAEPADDSGNNNTDASREESKIASPLWTKSGHEDIDTDMASYLQKPGRSQESEAKENIFTDFYRPDLGLFSKISHEDLKTDNQYGRHKEHPSQECHGVNNSVKNSLFLHSSPEGAEHFRSNRTCPAPFSIFRPTLFVFLLLPGECPLLECTAD